MGQRVSIDAECTADCENDNLLGVAGEEAGVGDDEMDRG